MTNSEIWDYFNLTYNNIASDMAAGILPSEASYFINRVIDEQIDSFYSNYEKNEAARKALIKLVAHESITSEYANSSISDSHIVENSKFYKIPDNLLYIVYESAKLKSSAKGCLSDSVIQIIPCTHDDFWSTYNNPFKSTNSKALRLDINDNGEKLSEIIFKANTQSFNNIKEYNIRYIRKPNKIDLENENDWNQDIISKDLDEKFHKGIIEAAANMCYAYYKQ